MHSHEELAQLETILEKERTRAGRILEILRSTLTIRDEDFASVLIARESNDPFRVIITTILSQSCTDISALRAYRRLEKRVGVTPDKLRRAKIGTIENSIRVAGLFRQKARAIRSLAKVCDSKDLRRILRIDVETARLELQQLPKVGPKTADVLLSIWGRPTISVDTHVDRVSKRLSLAPKKGKYEEVRESLMSRFDETDYTSIPLLFMAHGRRFCKALSPLCPICPVMRLCPFEDKSAR